MCVEGGRGKNRVHVAGSYIIILRRVLQRIRDKNNIRVFAFNGFVVTGESEIFFYTVRYNVRGSWPTGSTEYRRVRIISVGKPCAFPIRFIYFLFFFFPIGTVSIFTRFAPNTCWTNDGSNTRGLPDGIIIYEIRAIRFSGG